MLRPSSLLPLGPLFLLVLYRAPIRYKVNGLIVLARATSTRNGSGFWPMNDLELKAPKPRLYEDRRVPWDLLIGLSIRGGREELPYSISGVFRRSRASDYLR